MQGFYVSITSNPKCTTGRACRVHAYNPRMGTFTGNPVSFGEDRYPISPQQHFHHFCRKCLVCGVFSMEVHENLRTKNQPFWIFQTQSICRTRQGILEMKVRKIARIYLRGPSVWPLLFGAAMRGQGLEFCRWRFWLKILGDFLADMPIYMVYYGSIYSMTTGEGM